MNLEKETIEVAAYDYSNDEVVKNLASKMPSSLMALPWVGKNYERGINGVKIFILGDSGYWQEPNMDAAFASNEVCGLIAEIDAHIAAKAGERECYKPSQNTYTKFANAFLGKKDSDVCEFWSNVMFYNYVQENMHATRHTPTNKDYENGWLLFEEMVKLYEPDLVLVWGKNLWNHLPEDKGVDGKCILDDKYGSFYDCKIGGKLIHIFHGVHPSAAFSPEEYHPYINEAIEAVKMEKL
jgi:hypothetical protein